MVTESVPAIAQDCPGNEVFGEKAYNVVPIVLELITLGVHVPVIFSMECDGNAMISF